MIRILVSLLTLSSVLSLFAQSTTRDEVSDKIALQQAQIDQLRAAINEQKHTLDKVLQLLEAKSAASPAAEHPAVAPVQPAPIGANPKAAVVSGESPMTVHAGNLEITPGGFLDSAVVIRSTNIGSGLGTSFGGMPYPNTPAGQLSEVKFSAQNSRLSLRLKGNFGQTDLLGYLETDFLGNQPGNGVVSSNSNGLRLRLAFLDLRHGKWEILGGQAYSFLTPNRIGISSMPRDMFLTLDVDPNFHVGLTWTRAPQF